jgi:hypothetical protein
LVLSFEFKCEYLICSVALNIIWYKLNKKNAQKNSYPITFDKFYSMSLFFTIDTKYNIMPTITGNTIENII